MELTPLFRLFLNQVQRVFLFVLIYYLDGLSTRNASTLNLIL
jgi:hypothetical protein